MVPNDSNYLNNNHGNKSILSEEFFKKKMKNYFGENDYFENNKLKTSLINMDLYHSETTDIQNLNNK